MRIVLADEHGNNVKRSFTSDEYYGTARSKRRGRKFVAFKEFSVAFDGTEHPRIHTECSGGCA